MDSLRTVRGQVALQERALATGTSGPAASVPRVQPTPPAAPQQRPSAPTPKPQPRPAQLVPVGQEAARRPNLEELSIRAVEQMRRRGEVPNARLVDATKRSQAPRTEEAPRDQRARDTAELRSRAARAEAELRGDIRPVSARPASRQANPAIESRPTRELPPAEEPEPRPDPRRALQVVKRAVGSAYGADPTLTRAVNELTDFVNKTAPVSENEDVPDEQPTSDEKPAFEQQPDNEPPTQQFEQQEQEPEAGRSVLKVAPRYAFQRLMTSLAATQGQRGLPPGVALNLQG